MKKVTFVFLTLGIFAATAHASCPPLSDVGNAISSLHSGADLMNSPDTTFEHNGTKWRVTAFSPEAKQAINDGTAYVNSSQENGLPLCQYKTMTSSDSVTLIGNSVVQQQVQQQVEQQQMPRKGYWQEGRWVENKYSDSPQMMPDFQRKIPLMNAASRNAIAPNFHLI